MKIQYSQRSFTLLELLIVIAVIAILAATVLVSLSGARQSAWEARGLQFSQNIKTTLADGLVGEWSFDSTDIQGNIAKDTSGNGNNGTIYGATPTSQGKVREALSFDGVDDYVEIQDSDSLKQNGDLTIEAWINSSLSRRATIIHKHYNYEYDFGLEPNGGLNFWHGDGSWEGTAGQGPGSVKANQWTHVVAVRTMSNRRVTFYSNGQDTKAPWNFLKTNLLKSPNNIRIGRRNTGDNPFPGMIDEVRIYNRALTAYEIKALYAEGKMRHLADR